MLVLRKSINRLYGSKQPKAYISSCTEGLLAQFRSFVRATFVMLFLRLANVLRSSGMGQSRGRPRANVNLE